MGACNSARPIVIEGRPADVEEAVPTATPPKPARPRIQSQTLRPRALAAHVAPVPEPTTTTSSPGRPSLPRVRTIESATVAIGRIKGRPARPMLRDRDHLGTGSSGLGEAMRSTTDSVSASETAAAGPAALSLDDVSVEVAPQMTAREKFFGNWQHRSPAFRAYCTGNARGIPVADDRSRFEAQGVLVRTVDGLLQGDEERRQCRRVRWRAAPAADDEGVPSPGRRHQSAARCARPQICHRPHHRSDVPPSQANLRTDG